MRGYAAGSLATTSHLFSSHTLDPASPSALKPTRTPQLSGAGRTALTPRGSEAGRDDRRTRASRAAAAAPGVHGDWGGFPSHSAPPSRSRTLADPTSHHAEVKESGWELLGGVGEWVCRRGAQPPLLVSFRFHLHCHFHCHFHALDLDLAPLEDTTLRRHRWLLASSHRTLCLWVGGRRGAVCKDKGKLSIPRYACRILTSSCSKPLSANQDDLKTRSATIAGTWSRRWGAGRAGGSWVRPR